MTKKQLKILIENRLDTILLEQEEEDMEWVGMPWKDVAAKLKSLGVKSLKGKWWNKFAKNSEVRRKYRKWYANRGKKGQEYLASKKAEPTPAPEKPQKLRQLGEPGEGDFDVSDLVGKGAFKAPESEEARQAELQSLYKDMAKGGWDPSRVAKSNPKGAYGNKYWWKLHGPEGDGTWKTGPAEETASQGQSKGPVNPEWEIGSDGKAYETGKKGAAAWADRLKKDQEQLAQPRGAAGGGRAGLDKRAKDAQDDLDKKMADYDNW